jgi:predicted nucleic acid-binding protein
MADLGAGEREVLAFGIQLPDALLLLDERLARVHARALQLNFTGTLGILLRAKDEGHIRKRPAFVFYTFAVVA